MQAVQHRPLHKVPYRQSSLTVPLKSSGESPTINTSSRDHALGALCLCPAGTQLFPWEKPTWLSCFPWDLILIRFWNTTELAALSNSQILHLSCPSWDFQACLIAEGTPLTRFLSVILSIMIIWREWWWWSKWCWWSNWWWWSKWCCLKWSSHDVHLPIKAWGFS